MAGLLDAAFDKGLAVTAWSPPARRSAACCGPCASRSRWPPPHRRGVEPRYLAAAVTDSGFIPQADAALAALGDFRINCFGHLGDGNLHYNVLPAKGRSKADYLDRREAVKPRCMIWCMRWAARSRPNMASGG